MRWPFQYQPGKFTLFLFFIDIYLKITITFDKYHFRSRNKTLICDVTLLYAWPLLHIHFINFRSIYLYHLLSISHSEFSSTNP